MEIRALLITIPFPRATFPFTLHTEVVRPSETLIHIYQTAQRHIEEGRNLKEIPIYLPLTR
jgi:hypothetical protein